MLHLSTDRLAALGDDRPTPTEVEHLAVCDACAREREAFVSLVAMAAAERTQIGLPLTRWDAIAGALAADAPPVAPMDWQAGPRRARRWPMQIAAGLLLLAGGAMLGRASVGAGVLPAQPGVAAATGPARVRQVLAAATADSTPFASVDDARAAQRSSEVRYQQAAAYLARFDSTAAEGDPVAYRSRLAALDRVISTTRDAMREAPHDPVINGYYLTTLGQREATLQQMNTALPVSLRLNSY